MNDSIKPQAEYDVEIKVIENRDILTFKSVEQLLISELNITRLDENILKSLEFLKNDTYNNAGALLADQNRFKEIGIDLICYKDNKMQVIADSVH